MSTTDRAYQPFREGTQDIRLITTLSAEGEAAASPQIQCRLDLVSLDDQYHSPAYRKYLGNTNAYEDTGEFWKLAAASQECKQQGLEDWIVVSAPGDDATPPFRNSATPGATTWPSVIRGVTPPSLTRFC